MDFGYILSIVLLALGFGFVIFWHELGHFLAAKWAGVKVEQFAVGFGTAICSWRKGLGWRAGSSRREYEKRAREYLRAQEGGSNTSHELAEATTDDRKLDYAGAALGLGETEYRLNWLPLGGYVKMLGQDDLNPNATVNDPRAYNMQPIPKRMVIVSAGVIMNIILAAAGFFVLFLIGFKVQPAIVGGVVPGSPAQQAGLQVGDRILKIDDTPQLDFTKIPLNVALLPDNQDVKIELERADGIRQSVMVRALRGDRGMLSLGIFSASELRGLDPKKLEGEEPFDPVIDPPSMNQIRPGDEIVAINGQPIADPKKEFWKLDRALQHSDGKPFPISVRRADGKVETETVQPNFFVQSFSERDIDFLGMVPRTVVQSVLKESVMHGKLLPGDIITAIRFVESNDSCENPTKRKLQEMLDRAGQNDQKVQLTILRGDKHIELDPVVPSLTVEKKRLGIGVMLPPDELHAVIGGVEHESSAERAGVPQGATIVAIDDQPVSDWHDVQRILRGAKPDRTIKLSVRLPDAKDQAETKACEIKPTTEEIARVASYRYMFLAPFRELIEPRHTTNPLVAAAWGIGETRDLIFQFYLTLKRMVQRTVPASNLMGPLGIVQVGTKFAYKGNDWLIWFLSMISANLAVVNFLPIPIVDGGLFLFLIIEKLQGRPLSARTQSIAQVVGLALILSVFIFVTYQDIMR